MLLTGLSAKEGSSRNRLWYSDRIKLEIESPLAQPSSLEVEAAQNINQDNADAPMNKNHIALHQVERREESDNRPKRFAK